MYGRYLESMAQKFKNWGKTGFTGFYEPKSIKPAPILKKEEKPVKQEEKTTAFVGSGKSNTPIPKNISCGIKSIKIDGELLSLPNFYEFNDIDTKTKLNYELLEFMFSAYSRYGLLGVKDLVEFVEKNNLKSLLVKPKQDTVTNQRMTQKEFDNKVADILALGLNFSETRENIVSLNLSLSGTDEKLFYNSKILNAFIEANKKEIIQHILNS